LSIAPFGVQVPSEAETGLSRAQDEGTRLADAPLDAATLDRLFAAYIPIYESRIAEVSRPYPGAVAALDRFAAAGWRLAVCTNKLEGLSRRLLDELGLTERFAAICGGDTFPVRKPDAGHLIGTIARAGGDPARTVMVGDSVTDVNAAKNARVPVVGVTFGYTDAPVATFGPDAVIDHFDELWDAVAGLGTGSQG
jgi:phosphoglycolate phosphatase